MSKKFAETLKKIRTSKSISQHELAEKIFVTRSVIAKWENGYNLPNTIMIKRICKVLLILDDRKIVVQGSLSVVEEVLPNANIFGFTRPFEAIEFAEKKKISLVFLDIEMGKTNGLEICKKFLEINPQTNIIFLTAYVEYSFEAWSTGASGYLLKPITAEKLRAQLKNLRYPLINSGEIL